MQVGAPWAHAGEAWSAAGDETITELLRSACASGSPEPALVFEDGLTVSRPALLEAVEAFAGALRERVGLGDRVALIMGNRAEFMVAAFAVVANRAVVVPVDPDSGLADLRHVLANSGARLAVAEPGNRALIEQVAGDCPALEEVLVLDGDEPGGLPCGSAPPLRLVDSRCERSDLIGVWYTSGTTGLPKGCSTDHAWALRVTDIAMRVHPVGPDDRIMCPLRFHYADPLLDLLRSLKCGGAGVAVRRFSVSRFWDVVVRHGVTSVSTIASMPAWLLKAEPVPAERRHRIRFALHAAVPKELHHDLDERWGFPWLENYGMIECGVISRMPFEYAEEMRGTGSVGLPVPEVDVRVLDDGGAEVPRGEVGEIVMRGPGMFSGYLGMPEATAALLRDGWVYTGDLGRVDERGFLYIAGRKKDVIRRSGQNVSAAEVEAVLRADPRVLEAAVIGIPDADREEEIKAFVQLADGLAREDVALTDLVEVCEASLARYKTPRYWEIVPSFELTPSMRVQKAPLRAAPAVGPDTWDRLGG